MPPSYIALSLVLAVAAPVLVACNDEAVTHVPSSSCRTIDPLASSQSFSAAASCVGSASGSIATVYSGTFRDSRFSSDCTPAFARKHDFYVDDSAPDTTLQRVFREGYPDHPVIVTVARSGGRLRLDTDGDGFESPFDGWIDADGRFGAVAGRYVSSTDHYVAVYEGAIHGTEISGAFLARAADFDDPQTPGSCTFRAEFTAR